MPLMLLLAASLYNVSQIQAQSWVKDFEPETYIGVHGGASLINVDLSPGRDFNQKIGYMAGLSFLHISEEYFGGLLIEVHYMQLGWDELYLDEQTYNRNLEYISIPMFWQPYFGKKFRIFATAGPEIAFLLSDNYEMDLNESAVSYYHDKPSQNGFDFGFTGGLGLSGNFGKHKISLETRYYVGLTSLFERSLENNFDSAKNRALSFLLSYHIQLK